MLITLKNKFVSAAVTTDGAQLMSLQNDAGLEYLWQRNPDYWAGCAPVLFPCVGGLLENKTLIGGREYRMGRHGFARSSVFQVASQSDDKVVLVLSANEETQKCYPFLFELEVTYSLSGSALTTTFAVKNKGETPMPYAVGGHPAFNVPLIAGESFEDYRLEFAQPETAYCPEIGEETGLIDFNKLRPVLQNEAFIPLRHELFAGDALIFTELHSHVVRVVNKAGRGVEMGFEGFKMLGCWSAINNAPFVALEPWTACGACVGETGIFEEKRDMRFLAPGVCEEHSFSVTLL